MGRSIDLTGQQFGRLTVLRKAAVRNRNGNILWQCRCACGNELLAEGYSLRKGIVRSCGCLRREKASGRMKRLNGLLATDASPEQLAKVAGLNLQANTKRTRRNKSGVIGVSWSASTDRWIARLYLNGRFVLNKSFTNFADAVAARQAAEEQYLNPTLAAAAVPVESLPANPIKALITPAIADNADAIERIRQAYALLQDGIISDAEFDEIKQRLITKLD